ncbi:zona pellucida sperm-binding protein 3-like [Arapaima gigas]
MKSHYHFVAFFLLGCFCDGQVFQGGSSFQLPQESLMQPVYLSQQRQSFLPAGAFPQGKPLQGFQGQSSWQLAPVGSVQLGPQGEASNQLSSVVPAFHTSYGQALPQAPQGQPSVQVLPGNSVFQTSYGQTSNQVPPMLPSGRVPPGHPMLQAPVSAVQLGNQAQASVQSQWLVAPSGVKVECREDSILVSVQQDMLGTGQLIQPSEIALGGCGPTGEDPSTGMLMFESPLQGCGSTVMMTDSLVYSFVLVYKPQGIGSTPIVRSSGAVINIECHYLRRYNVSSNAVMPTWIPYSASLSAEDRLAFSLLLMTNDWQLERTSNVYFLGDILNIEASVVVANHQPLRVFVDSCVATSNPDVTSVPRYAFVENHGCLTDAKLIGSRSQFLPRKQDNKLQMQLDAFRFSQETSSSLYITCILKATMASKNTDPQHKACSHSVATNRWVAADGNDQVCGCCDGTCSFRKGRNVPDFKGEAAIGPIFIQNPSYRLS